MSWQHFLSFPRRPSGAAGPTGVEFTPTMTSNSAPSGYTMAATSAFDGSSPAWKAMNKSAGAGYTNGWSSSAQATSGSPQILTFTSSAANTAYTYSIQIRSDANTTVPIAWKLQGSNDGSSWTDLDTVTGQSWTNGETKNYTVDTPGSYTQYRLNITDSGSLCQIDEWRMYA